jgi:hypothetical protein
MSNPIFAPLAKTRQSDIERRLQRPHYEAPPRSHRGPQVRRAIVAIRILTARRQSSNPTARQAD